MNELIVIKQLPVIEEELKKVSEDIDAKVKNALAMVCDEDTYKTVKDIRANLTKEFKNWEEKRKDVKNQIMKPYEEFEKVYKNCISDKFQNADKELKTKIDTVESGIKAQKEEEIKRYFEEYKTANNLDFVEYKQVGVNVTMSVSMKSLKEQVKGFIDKVVMDLQLIDTQEHKAEILVEYKQDLNVSKAITTVSNRFKAIEEEKKKQEIMTKFIVETGAKEIHVPTIDEVPQVEFEEPLQAPIAEVQEEILTLKFTVKGTRSKLKALKEFLENGGYDYE